MAKMKLCKRCVNPNTRPNVHIDEKGICRVCRHLKNVESGQLDWSQRKKEILDIAQWGKDNSKNAYDCIVTVSGGKDSTRQAFFAREELGLNPLLVSCVYPPEELSELGATNLSMLVENGFDCITISLDPKTWKKLMQESFKRYRNIFNASEMALYAIPIHTAIAHQIPLVFLGENPAFTIGEKHGRLDGDASQMRNCNTLKGGKANKFISENINRQNLYFYNYPPEKDVVQAGLKLVYLGYYIEDWSGFNNANFSISKGLQIRNEPPENIGDLWGFSGLDEEFRLVNQWIKFVKFGFGHVTDQVMELIHSGKITREEGLELVEKYDGKCHPKYIKRLCHYLDISKEKFQLEIEEVRDPELWRKNINDKWELVVDR